jgi:DNA polymerase elongation subunit (family B)
MSKIVFDIETAGEDFEKMDDFTKEFLEKKAKLKVGDGNDDEVAKEMEKTKDSLVFSPLTGQIVAIGVLDVEQKKGAVYYQTKDSDNAEREEGGVKLKPMTEKEMLKKFWEVTERATEMISFNGRGFDAPYLMIRSAIHKIRPTRDLLSNRYLSLQRGLKHIDLMDQLNFYGATWGKINLHLACRAFGIKTPKDEGVEGDDVTRLFAEGKYLDIARYNARDLFSTAELYRYWDKYLRFQ